MIELSLNQILLLIVIPLFVGLLTNFIWESFFRKSISVICNCFLKFMSFGMLTFIDSIYKDIARKNIHKPITSMTFLIMLFSSILLGYTASGLTKEHSKSKYEIQQEVKSKSTDELKADILVMQNDINNREDSLAIMSFCLSLLLSLYALQSHIRNAYVISAILHFEQCLSIIRPYITEQIYLATESEFSLISNSLEYKHTLSGIYTICLQNNIKPPQFLPL